MLLIVALTFFVNRLKTDRKSSLPRLSNPPTHLFQSSHILFYIVHIIVSSNSSLLIQNLPFIKDLGVGYKVTPIISVLRIVQCNHLEFLPLVQSLIFCFTCVLSFNIRSSWRFRSWEANSRKLIPEKWSFGPFPRQQIPEKKKLYEPCRKNSPPLPAKKIVIEMNKFTSSTDCSVYFKC